MTPEQLLLGGVSVLELGDGVAGSVAAAQLAALGADVHKVVGPSRAISSHEPRVPRNGALIAALLDRAKTSVEDDRRVVEDLVLQASIVIDDRVDRVADPASHVAEVARRNRSVWVTISPFGLDGPRAGDPGGELMALAAGGLLSTIADGAGTPVSPPGFLGLRTVGHVAALAALHGLDHHRVVGTPVHVDVSAQESVAMVGALPECAHVLYRCPGRAGSGRYVAPSGAFRCRDGFVRIAAIENHQWAAMVRVLGAPAWTAGLDDRPARAEHAALITAKVGEWAAELDKDTCAAILQREGVPSTPVNGPDEILVSEQFRHRSFIVGADLDGVAVRTVGTPWRLDLDDSASAAAPPRPLSELRVAEFTHVLAAPIAGALVGAMGADVVRLEELDRLDLYRRTGPFADGQPGIERGAYFAVANHSKRSIGVAEEDASRIARQLVDHADIVLENVGGRRLAKLAVSIPEIRDRRPATLVASLSGFGNDGPLAGYRVYANNVQAYGGLAFLSRGVDGELARVGTVLADVLSSVVTATVMSAWWLGPMRAHGGTLDLSMAEVVATTVAEFVAEASIGPDRTVPRGCELAPFAPHGVYRTADEHWVAVSVQSDDEWTQLLAGLGDPPSLVRDGWERANGRFAARTAVDDALGALIGERDRDDVVRALTAVGTRCTGVLDGAALVADPHLQARGFFPRVLHPDPELSEARVVGVAWRFVGEGPIALGPPPALGSTPADAFAGAMP